MKAIDLTLGLGKYETALRNYAFRLTKDPGDACDLFQETAYRAIKNFHQFRTNTNLRSWLMTIMRNTFLNAYRKKKRILKHQDGNVNAHLIDSLANSVQNEGEVQVEYDELNNQVNALERPLHLVFLMALEGYSYNEIAEELNIPIGTVKSRVFQARKKLRKAIYNLYGSEVENSPEGSRTANSLKGSLSK